MKGPVKLIQLVKIAHSFLQSVKSVPLCHFKIAYVVLRMAVLEFFYPLIKTEKEAVLILRVIFDQP